MVISFVIFIFLLCFPHFSHSLSCFWLRKNKITIEIVIALGLHMANPNTIRYKMCKFVMFSPIFLTICCARLKKSKDPNMVSDHVRATIEIIILNMVSYKKMVVS